MTGLERLQLCLSLADRARVELDRHGIPYARFWAVFDQVESQMEDGAGPKSVTWLMDETLSRLGVAP